MNTKTQASAWQKLLAVVFAIAAAFSLAGALTTAPALTQAAWADDDNSSTYSLPARDDVSVIGSWEDYCDVYYAEIPSEYSSVDLSGFVGEDISVDMIAQEDGSHYTEGTPIANIASYPATTGFLANEEESFVFNESAAGLNFAENTYVLKVITDNEDFDMCFIVLKWQKPAVPSSTEDVCVVSVEGVPLSNVALSSEKYSYVDYVYDPENPEAEYGYVAVPGTADVYVATVPAGTTTVKLSYPGNRIAYNYTKDGQYLEGDYPNNGAEGAATSTHKVDCNNDGEPDYIQVQKPYGDPEEPGHLLYVITFKYADAQPINSVSLSKTKYTYNGKAKTPAVTVKDATGKVLTKGTDYTVAYKRNVNAGTATVAIAGTGNYSGTITKSFTIEKASQKVTAKKTTATKKFKAKKGKLTSTKTVKSVKSAFGLSAKSSMTFKKSSGNKKITVSKSGKVTIKKGLKKGTYKVKIKVAAAASTNYNKATKTVTLKVVVK